MAYKRRQRRRRQRGGNINIEAIKNKGHRYYKKGRAKLNSLIKRVIKTKQYWSSLGGKKQKRLKQKGGWYIPGHTRNMYDDPW